jgi:hypothetical protein
MVMKLPGSWLLRQSSLNSIDRAATASKLAGFGYHQQLRRKRSEAARDRKDDRPRIREPCESVGPELYNDLVFDGDSPQDSWD